MQVDQDHAKNGEMKIEEEPTAEVQSDEMMKTTISSEKEKEEGQRGQEDDHESAADPEGYHEGRGQRRWQ